jgi:hypothetical protein
MTITQERSVSEFQVFTEKRKKGKEEKKENYIYKGA